jgi:hypothetical protein
MSIALPNQRVFPRRLRSSKLFSDREARQFDRKIGAFGRGQVFENSSREARTAAFILGEGAGNCLPLELFGPAANYGGYLDTTGPA